MDYKKKIYIAGDQGMVGSAIKRELKDCPQYEVVVRSRAELDLTNQQSVKNFFYLEKPDQVYLAAAKVGGISANNSYPADFIYENLMIQNNVIHEAWRSGVERLIFLGSSCIYPRFAAQPIKEEELLSGYLEPTNEPYAIAKIAGIKLCESFNRQYNTDFRSVMPTNLYGPGDNYHPENSHVIPGLIRKFHEAKQKKIPSVNVWGSGHVKREFLFVDDMARASIFIMNLKKTTYASITKERLSHINIGFGEDISIKDLSLLIAQVIGFEGAIVYDKSKPEGVERKLMDSSKLKNLGWVPNVDLKSGLQKAYNEFLKINN